MPADGCNFGSSTTLFFHPRELADFVIHYNNTAPYVHRLVLHSHSAYFKQYFQALGGFRLTSSTPADAAYECDHPHIAHCINLPKQTRSVWKTAVTAADFRLFLCHLYFSQHYRYPPYLPQTDIDLDTDSPPLCHTFPPSTSLDWCTASSPLRFMRCQTEDPKPSTRRSTSSTTPFSALSPSTTNSPLSSPLSSDSSTISSSLFDNGASLVGDEESSTAIVHLEGERKPEPQQVEDGADGEETESSSLVSLVASSSTPSGSSNSSSSSPSLSPSSSSVASDITGDEEFLYSESLLTLARYLDCVQTMQQCEAVILTKVNWAHEHRSAAMWLFVDCLLWLPYADRYMDNKLCIDVIAGADRGMFERQELREAEEEWDAELWAEVVEAINTRVSGERQRRGATFQVRGVLLLEGPTA